MTLAEHEAIVAIAAAAREDRNARVLLRTALRQLEATAELLRLLVSDEEEPPAMRAPVLETMGQADADLVAD